MTRQQTASITVFALVLCLGATRPAQAEITRMSVHVDGLTCPFCVFNLEKNCKASSKSTARTSPTAAILSSPHQVFSSSVNGSSSKVQSSFR